MCVFICTTCSVDNQLYGICIWIITLLHGSILVKKSLYKTRLLVTRQDRNVHLGTLVRYGG